MSLRRADLTALLEVFEEHGLSELVASVGGTRVELTSSGKPPRSAPAWSRPAAPAPAAPMPAAAAATSEFRRVLAPSVGIFYVAPAPGAPPFTTVGERVTADDVVCVVAVMEVIHHVKAASDGIVRSVDAENGELVEHGQLLFTIAPDAA